jgi:diguanylate cyclase (GGDEF)-like protein
MLRKIQLFLAGGQGQDRATRSYRLVFFHNATSLVGLAAAALLLPVNYLHGHTAIAGALAVVMLASLHNLYAVRRQDRIGRANFITLATLLPLFVILVADGGIEGSGPYWLGLYPLLTFFVAGLRGGLAWNALFLTLLAGMMLLRAAGAPFIVPSTLQLSLLMAAYVFFTLFCAAYEYFRFATDEALRQSRESLRQQAMYDPLTGLPNRALLYDRLKAAVEQSQRYQRRFALLFIDLDGFKAINDTLGHVEGDTVLRAMAERLRHLSRQADTVARHGGDEFVWILDEPRQASAAVDVARRCIEELGRPLHVDDHTLTLGASIGIARYPEHGTDPDTLIQAADTAMYAAKRAGRNTWRVAVLPAA